MFNYFAYTWVIILGGLLIYVGWALCRTSARFFAPAASPSLCTPMPSRRCSRRSSTPYSTQPTEELVATSGVLT
jgi:hypothetical protein